MIQSLLEGWYKGLHENATKLSFSKRIRDGCALGYEGAAEKRNNVAFSSLLLVEKTRRLTGKGNFVAFFQVSF